MNYAQVLVLVSCCSLSAIALALTPEQITARGRASTVFITVERPDSEGKPPATGTGFVVNSHGYVLTSKHLLSVEPGVNLSIKGALQSRHGTLETMELVSTDAAFDFALLRFSNTSIPRVPVALANPWNSALNAPLQALGFPLSLEFTGKTGTLLSMGGPSGAWITDIDLNPGDSGAPVFDRDGYVIAMVVSGLQQADGVKFILPITFSANLLALVGLERIALPPPDEVEERFKVDRTRESSRGLFPTSDVYTQTLDAKDGHRIVSAELIRTSESHVSDVEVTVGKDGLNLELKYTLTSGPIYDQYRGWLKGLVVTKQVPYK